MILFLFYILKEIVVDDAIQTEILNKLNYIVIVYK